MIEGKWEALITFKWSEQLRKDRQIKRGGTTRDSRRWERGKRRKCGKRKGREKEEV